MRENLLWYSHGIRKHLHVTGAPRNLSITLSDSLEALGINEAFTSSKGFLKMSDAWVYPRRGCLFLKWIFWYCTAKVENGTWKLRPIFFLYNYNHIMQGFRGKRSHWKTSAMILEEPNSMEKGACIVSIFFGGYIHVGPAESRVGGGLCEPGVSFTGVVLSDEQVSNMVGVEHLPVQQRTCAIRLSYWG